MSKNGQNKDKQGQNKGKNRPDKDPQNKTRNASHQSSNAASKQTGYNRMIQKRCHSIVVQEDGVYDVKISEGNRGLHIYKENKPGYWGLTPKVDRDFVRSRNIKDFELVGCVGFQPRARKRTKSEKNEMPPCSRKPLELSVILKYYREDIEELYELRRSQDGTLDNYEWPVFVSRQFFVKEMGGDEDKALEFFYKTDLGKRTRKGKGKKKSTLTK